MDSRKTLLIVGALILAILLAFAGKAALTSREQNANGPQLLQASPPKGPRVLVATRALPIGTILGPDSFRFQPWPKDLMQNAYFVDTNKVDLASLNGRVVRTAISAGQPLTQDALVKPGDRGFLAAALGPGMRAITVPVSALSGVAGFVFPGDRVDLVLTQTIENETQSLHASETILRNLKVLATDQRTSSLDAKGNQTVQLSSMVTLEVTPRMAEKISVALTIGQLSLALRAITDGGLEEAIASGKVRLPDGVDSGTEHKVLNVFAARPEDGTQSYATGADVSAFQRRYAGRRLSKSTAGGAAPSPTNAPQNSNAGSAGVRVWRAGAAQAVTF